MATPILYSLCWEDPSLVNDALRVRRADKTLVIASGGENVFALLLRRPARLVAIDTNAAQLHLVSLKAAAIQALEFDECAEFLGYRDSRRRHELYARCERYLGAEAKRFWKEHRTLIAEGVIHAGRFERYLRMFRSVLLPMILGEKDIERYLSCNSIAGRKRFYDETWDTWRWRGAFRIFFSRPAMEAFGRTKAAFKHNQRQGIAQHYLRRAKKGIVRTPTKDNQFIHYLLTGTVPIPCNGHPYLDKRNFTALKTLVGGIEFAHDDVGAYLRTGGQRFDKYALSDIFEFMTQKEYEATLDAIARATPGKGRVCYWNNLVTRAARDSARISPDDTVAKRLASRDRVFFYSAFIVQRINDRT